MKWRFAKWMWTRGIIGGDLLLQRHLHHSDLQLRAKLLPAKNIHKSWQRSAPTFWTQREQGPDQACFHRRSSWQGLSLKRKYLTRSRRLRELITVAMAQSPPILALSFLMSLFFDSRMTKKVCIIGRVGHPQKPVFAHNILAILFFFLWYPLISFLYISSYHLHISL